MEELFSVDKERKGACPRRWTICTAAVPEDLKAITITAPEVQRQKLTGHPCSEDASKIQLPAQHITGIVNNAVGIFFL